MLEMVFERWDRLTNNKELIINNTALPCPLVSILLLLIPDTWNLTPETFFLSSVLCHLSSVICPPSSVFRPLRVNKS
jgi:hypothetical protein